MRDLFMSLHPLLAELDISGTTLADLAGENTVVVLAVYGVLIALGLLVDIGLLLHIARGRSTWRRGVSRLVWRPWSWREGGWVMLCVLGFFLFTIVVQNTAHWLSPASFESEPGLWVLSQSVTIHWPVLIFLVWFLRRRRVSWEGAFGIRSRTFLKEVGLGVLFYVGIVPVVAFYSWLYNLVLYSVGYEPDLQDVALAITADASPGVRIYLLGLAMILAPFFEEILFRGIGLPLFVQRWGVGRGVVFVSICFAAIHFHIPSLVALFLLAVAFSLAYIYTGSLVVPTVMHGLFNAVNLGLLLYLR